MKLKLSGLYSSLFVIRFTLIFQKKLVVGGQKRAFVSSNQAVTFSAGGEDESQSGAAPKCTHTQQHSGGCVSGPALRVGGVSAEWEGDDTSRLGEIGASCRVILQGSQGSQLTSWLELVNYGSTVIRFNWTVSATATAFLTNQSLSLGHATYTTLRIVVSSQQKLPATLFLIVLSKRAHTILTRRERLKSAPL